MDGVDDLGGIYPIEVDRSDPEIHVTELALDHVQRDALAGHLDGVCVPQLVGGETAADAGLGCDAA